MNEQTNRHTFFGSDAVEFFVHLGCNAVSVGNCCLTFGDSMRVFVFKGQTYSFSFGIFTFENETTMLVNSSLHFRVPSYIGSDIPRRGLYCFFLKMKLLHPFKTSVTIYQATWRNIPDDFNLQ